MRFFSFILILLITASCSFQTNRHPASFNKISNKHKVDLNISFEDFKFAFEEVTKKSKIVKSINHFYMDPVTRILNINLTLNYPLGKILDFSELPADAKPSDLHEVELGIRFDKAQNMYKSRYIGIQLTKLLIDGDDYSNQFDLALSTIKTVLANTELVNYLLIENKDQFSSKDYLNLVSEAFESNAIIVFPETKKIKIKLDLSMFSDFVYFAERYEDINVWKLEPTTYKEDNVSSYNENDISNDDVAFNITLGIGKPSDTYILNHQNEIKTDKRTLEELRNDFYHTYSDEKQINAIAHQFLSTILSSEKDAFYKFINGTYAFDRSSKFGRALFPMKKKFNSALDDILRKVENKASEKLNMKNEHFVAAPEYEYQAFLFYMKNIVRNEVNLLRRTFHSDLAILKQGDPTKTKKPLLVKKISQNIINGTLLSLMDLEIDGIDLIKDPSVWLRPENNELILKGKVNLPLPYLLSKINANMALQQEEYKSYINDTNDGIPFEISTLLTMEDNGKLLLDLKSFSYTSNQKRTILTRSSKNHQFIFDFFKLFLSKTLAAVEIDLSDEETTEERKQRELKEVIDYLGKVKKAFNKKLNIDDLISSDILINPFNTASSDYVERKRKILLKEIVKFRPDKKLELKVDPAVVVEKIGNVKHNLQLWDVRALFSSALNNTFLELSIGDGKRNNDFILDQYARRGQMDNANHTGISYEFGKDRHSTDIIFSLDFNSLEEYINKFLAEYLKTENKTVKEKALEKKGETFYELNGLTFDIRKDSQLSLTATVKRGKFGRSWTHISSWWSGKYIEDQHMFKFLISLKSAEFNKQSTQLSNLTYYPQAISVNPLDAKVLPGYGAGVLGRAVAKLANVAAYFALKADGIKALLLKFTDKFLNKMYNENNGKILGHEIEKVVRLHTTSKELLIFLNPKLAGSGFNVHLAGDEDPVKTSIKLDPKNEIAHFALTSGVNMIKLHKKELYDIYLQMESFLTDFRKADSKEELKKILEGQNFAHKLTLDDTDGKTGFYRRFIKTMANYNQVLFLTELDNTFQIVVDRRVHTANPNNLLILDQSEINLVNRNESKRISAAGSELLYFAALAKYLNKTYYEVLQKMKKYGLNHRNHDSKVIISAYEVLDTSIINNLIDHYKKYNHPKNKIILKNKPSFWTYQVYPDAYFAEKMYEILK